MKSTFLLISAFCTVTSGINQSIGTTKTKNALGQLYVLGDDWCDVGALSGGAADWFHASLILPSVNQVIIDGPYYQNRSFSDGAPGIEQVAQKLNRPLSPAWKFTTATGPGYEKIGTDYAFGGARAGTALSATGTMYNTFSLQNQVIALLSQHQITNNDQCFLQIGINDLMAAMAQSLTLFQNLIINDAINNQFNALTNLVKAGAKHIVIANLPDIGWLPLYNTDQATTQLAHKLWNSYTDTWNTNVATFQATYPGVLKVYDLYQQMYYAMDYFHNADPANDIANGALQINFNHMFVDGHITAQFSPSVNFNNYYHYFFLDQMHTSHVFQDTIAKELINLFPSS